MTKKESKNMASKRCIARKKVALMRANGETPSHELISRLTLGLTREKAIKYENANKDLFMSSSSMALLNKLTQEEAPKGSEFEPQTGFHPWMLTPPPTNKFGGYSVKGVKKFMGREGYGYNATLLKDGKKIGTILDDASGGPVDVDITWNHPKRKELENELKAYCKTQPKKVYEFGSYDYDEESLAYDLVQDALLMKKVNSKRNTHCFFNDEDGGFSIKRNGHSIEAIVKFALKDSPKATLIVPTTK